MEVGNGCGYGGSGEGEWGERGDDGERLEVLRGEAGEVGMWACGLVEGERGGREWVRVGGEEVAGDS